MILRQLQPGERFGFRVVLRDAPNAPGTYRKVRVRCDCGTEGYAGISALLKGKADSCASCGAKRRAAKRHDKLVKANEVIAELRAENAKLKDAAARARKLWGCACGATK